jgi:putative peptidoglycan lipid II flippase
VLLAAALVVGGGVAGGVVAYQLAMVVFLAPYGVLSQPIHTAVLPRLSADASTGDHAALGDSLRWSVRAMAAVTLPVSAALVVLALPIMRVLAFGEAAEGDGPRLLAAALAGLGAGVFPYGCFLLLSRAFYAIGDSRTPAFAALGSAVVGAAVMVGSGALDGVPRLAGIGIGHTVAFVLGAAWLARRLRSVVGSIGLADVARPLGLTVALALAGWWAVTAWSPQSRPSCLAAIAVVGAAGAVVYVGALRSIGALPGRAPTLERLA